MFQIPKFDMPVPYCYEITSILRKRYCFHFGTNFITCYFYVAFPFPHIDYHVMLCTYADYVFICRWKCLEKKYIKIFLDHSNRNSVWGINFMGYQFHVKGFYIQYPVKNKRILFWILFCIGVIFIFTCRKHFKSSIHSSKRTLYSERRKSS